MGGGGAGYSEPLKGPKSTNFFIFWRGEGGSLDQLKFEVPTSLTILFPGRGRGVLCYIFGIVWLEFIV